MTPLCSFARRGLTRAFRPALIAFALLGACSRSETPSSSTVCLALNNLSGSPGGDECEPRMCIQELQRFSASDRVTPWNCSNCGTPPESSDQQVILTTLLYSSQTLTAFFEFDSRIKAAPTLASLRMYARDAHGWYTTNQGKMIYSDAPFEVVSFENGQLRLRLDASLKSVTYQESTLPRDCGQGILCTEVTCRYLSTTPGSDPGLAELVADVSMPAPFGTP